MGSLTPVTQILPVLAGVSQTASALQNTIGAFRNFGGSQDRREQDQALDQLRQRQALEQAQGAQNAALERERMATEARQNEAERRSALRRAVARQRANFGSQGVGSQGGSSQAVLLGLFDESQDDLARRQEIDNLRSRAIDQNLDQQSALNLLQATQLAERQRLARLF